MKPGWRERLQQLISYFEKHGHCLVPIDYEEAKGLGRWVETQRRERRKQLQGKRSILNATRIAELESLGFNWDPEKEKIERVDKEADKEEEEGSWGSAISEDELPTCEDELPEEDYEDLWNAKFSELKNHLMTTETGDPTGGDYLPTSLAGWVLHQRHQYRLGRSGRASRLTEDKIQRLEEIGFKFENKNNHSDGEGEESNDDDGDEDKSESESMGVDDDDDESFHEESNDGDDDDKNEAETWVYDDDDEASDGGEVIAYANPAWDYRFNMLQAYMKKHYPRSRYPNGAYVTAKKCKKTLCGWVMNQRRFYRLKQKGRKLPKGKKLNDVQIRKLESIGFLWENNIYWRPESESESEDDGEEDSESSDEEEESNPTWEHKFNMMKKHMEEHYPKSRYPHGAYVPWKTCQKPLAGWMANQRYFYRNKQKGIRLGRQKIITDEQVRRLDSIGFLWEDNDTWRPKAEAEAISPIWESKFNILKVQMEKHYPKSRYPRGAYVAPCKFKEPLQGWLKKQRYYYRLKKEGKKTKFRFSLSDEQIRRLESIGFLCVDNDTWRPAKGEYESSSESESETAEKPKPDPSQDQWLFQFDKLKLLMSRCYPNGGYVMQKTCRGRLFNWVARQRYQYRLKQAGNKSPMTNARIEKLESIGFFWEEGQLPKRRPIIQQEDPSPSLEAAKKAYDRRWKEWYKQYKNLVQHMRKHYPKSKFPNGVYVASSQCEKRLRTWVTHQRWQYRLKADGWASNITDKRIEYLDKIGFLWESEDRKPASKSRNHRVVQEETSESDEEEEEEVTEDEEETEDEEATEDEEETEDESSSESSVEESPPKRSSTGRPKRQQKDPPPSQVTKKETADRHWKTWYAQYQRLVRHMRKHYPKSKYPNGAYVAASQCEKRLCTWVKHQRWQYRLKTSGQPCRLSDKRIECLERIGFLWQNEEETDGKATSSPKRRRVAREVLTSESDEEEESEDEGSLERSGEESEEESEEENSWSEQSSGDEEESAGPKSGVKRGLESSGTGDNGNTGTELPGSVDGLLGLSKRGLIDLLERELEEKETLESQLEEALDDVKNAKSENKLLTDMDRDLKEYTDTLRASHEAGMIEERSRTERECKRRKLAEDQLEKTRQLIPFELDDAIFL